MTPTIDLQRGLEVWYDLSSKYFDSQNNRMQDKSGYGRHAEASGGLTVGVEGPDSFEATSFDGSDDVFGTGDSLAVSGAQTVFAIAKMDVLDGGRHIIVGNDDGTNGYALRTKSNNDLNFYIRGSTNSVVSWSGVETNVWYRILAYHDGMTTFLVVDGDLKTTDDTLSGQNTGDDNTQIGNYPRNDHDFQGDIAAVARWSRALSWSEIQYLTDFTGPRRGTL